MFEDNEHFYLSKEEPVRSCLLAMKDVLINFHDDISETKKYGMPCFCYKGKMFCYLWVDKKTGEPYFLIVEGKHIEHPSLEVGDRKRMKILRVNSNQDLPVDAINEVFAEALKYYQS